MRRFESSHPSQPVWSLWFGFPVWEKLRHFRRLGFQAEVSGRRPSNFGSPAAGFTAAVSAHHFPISVLVRRRPGSRCARERFGKGYRAGTWGNRRPQRLHPDRRRRRSRRAAIAAWASRVRPTHEPGAMRKRVAAGAAYRAQATDKPEQLAFLPVLFGFPFRSTGIQLVGARDRVLAAVK